MSYLIATNNRYDMKQTSSCFLCFSQALSFHFLGAERSIRASGLWEISWEEKKGHSVEWEVKGQFVSWCRLETDPRLGPRNWEELSSWVSPETVQSPKPVFACLIQTLHNIFNLKLDRSESLNVHHVNSQIWVSLRYYYSFN